MGVLVDVGELLGDTHIAQQPDRSVEGLISGLHLAQAMGVDAHHLGDVGEAFVHDWHVERPHTRKRDGVVQSVMGVVERRHRVADRVDDAQATGVERLRRDVLRVHHAFAAGELGGVPGGLTQVPVGEPDGVQRVAQRRLEVQPGHVRLGGMGQHVETALGGEGDRAVVVQHRVVDREGGHRGVIEGDVLVRLVGVGGGVGDDICPRSLRTRSSSGGYGDMRRVLGILALVEALELVDAAAVVGHGDAGTLAGVVSRPATDGDERVALLRVVERDRVHDVVVLGIGLDLVEYHDLKTVVLARFGDLVNDVRAPQTGGHDQRLLEAQLQRLGTDHLVGTGAHHGPGEGVEFLDGERLQQFIYLHDYLLALCAVGTSG